MFKQCPFHEVDLVWESDGWWCSECRGIVTPE